MRRHPHAGGRRWFRRVVLPPLLALLCVQLAIVVAALVTSKNPLRGSTYARWDSYHYITIATRGYYIEKVGDEIVRGNVGWFPGYPLTIRALKLKGVTRALNLKPLTPAKTGKLVSTAFAFGLLVVMWKLLSTAEGITSPAIALLLAAFFPGFIYYHAVFPISMVAFLDVVALWSCARGRFLASGLLGALGATAYPTGVLVAAPLCLGILLNRELSPGRRLAALAQAPLLVGLGPLAVFFYQAKTVGWDAFLRMRREFFDNQMSNPLATLASNTAHVWHGELVPALLPEAQTVLTATLILGIGYWCWRHRSSLTLLEQMLWANATLFWLFPQFVGVFGATRADALLVAMVPLLGRLPAVAQRALLALLVPLGIGLCMLFFQGVLV